MLDLLSLLVVYLLGEGSKPGIHLCCAFLPWCSFYLCSQSFGCWFSDLVPFAGSISDSSELPISSVLFPDYVPICLGNVFSVSQVADSVPYFLFPSWHLIRMWFMTVRVHRARVFRLLLFGLWMLHSSCFCSVLFYGGGCIPSVVLNVVGFLGWIFQPSVFIGLLCRLSVGLQWSLLPVFGFQVAQELFSFR